MANKYIKTNYEKAAAKYEKDYTHRRAKRVDELKALDTTLAEGGARLEAIDLEKSAAVEANDADAYEALSLERQNLTARLEMAKDRRKYVYDSDPATMDEEKEAVVELQQIYRYICAEEVAAVLPVWDELKAIDRERQIALARLQGVINLIHKTREADYQHPTLPPSVGSNGELHKAFEEAGVDMWKDGGILKVL